MSASMESEADGAELRVGLVGFGYASQTFHAPLLRTTPGYRITAVASSRPDAVRASLPEAEIVGSPERLFSRADLDVVVIATPNETHAELAATALEGGRHVVVDKPFTVTSAEARELARVAAHTGRLLSVFHNRRHDTDFRTVADALGRGLIGRISHFESRFDRFRPTVRDRWRERGGPGSGLWYDLGPHLLDQALVLFGAPDDVSACLAAQRSGARATDFFRVELRYGAALVTLDASSLVAGGSARFTVHGELGSLVKREADPQEAALRAGMLPGSTGWGIDSDPAVLHEANATRALPALAGDQRDYYRDVRRAIAGLAPNPVPPEQGAAVMVLIEAALQSHAEGRRVAPELTEDERHAHPATCRSALPLTR